MTKQSGYATKQTGYFWTKQLGLNTLSSYSGSTTISVANIKNVIKKYSPSARVNGLNKEKLLQLLEDIRKNNNITNADLCNKFADEIYLPKIVLKKADIPLSLRSQFIDLR